MVTTVSQSQLFTTIIPPDCANRIAEESCFSIMALMISCTYYFCLLSGIDMNCELFGFSFKFVFIYHTAIFI